MEYVADIWKGPLSSGPIDISLTFYVVQPAGQTFHLSSELCWHLSATTAQDLQTIFMVHWRSTTKAWQIEAALSGSIHPLCL